MQTKLPKNELPLDLADCHALIQELLARMEEQSADIQSLKLRLKDLLREKYGRNSEKLSPGQLQLFGEAFSELMKEVEATNAAVEPDEPVNQQDAAKKKNGGGGRKSLPAKLSREVKEYFPSEAEMLCQCCNKRKSGIGAETTEQLEYIPSRFKVIEHVRYKFACKVCQDGVVEGKKPAQFMNGGMPTEGVIAHISVSKFGDHLPLHRLEQIFAREGVEVSRSSMGRWLNVSAMELKPIVLRMQTLLLQSRVIQADESPVLFLDKARLPKKSKQGYAWVYYGDDGHPYVIYDFQPDRTAERPRAILSGYAGVLLTDGYGGYEWFAFNRSANCMVHSRRKFEKSLNYDKKKAGLILAMFTELYKIESRLAEAMVSEETIAVTRQSESTEILMRMKAQLEEWRLTVPPKTPLGEAIKYTLSRWEKLTRFIEYPYLRPDTNLVENAIRPIAVGRNAWMHIGSEDALETASIHATLVNTCKRLEVNPFEYIRDVLKRLAAGETELDDLLPDRWQLGDPVELTDCQS